MGAAAAQPSKDDFLRKLHTISKPFADAAVHLSRSCRDQYLRLAKAAAQGDYDSTVSGLNRMSESQFVLGVTSNLNAAKDKASALLAEFEKFGGTLGKIVVGLTLVAAGSLGGSTVGALIALLLVLAGLALALDGVWDLIGRSGALTLQR